MKISVDRQEKKGPFGGTYYEARIQVSLTSQEESLIWKARLMDVNLLGSSSVSGDSVDFSDDSIRLIRLLGKSTLSFSELVSGIKAKANNESELSGIAWLESEIRARCKQIKERINTMEKNMSAMNQSFEEEI